MLQLMSYKIVGCEYRLKSTKICFQGEEPVIYIHHFIRMIIQIVWKVIRNKIFIIYFRNEVSLSVRGLHFEVFPPFKGTNFVHCVQEL
jgi:hypothetical protein